MFGILLTFALALAGCPGADDDDTSSDDDDATADGDDDATGDDDTGDDDTTDGGTCGALVGAWQLTRFECGEYDITDDWLAAIPSTVLEASAGVDGCDVVLTNASDSCVEVKQFLYEVGEDTMSGEDLGIISCTPDACTFTEEDAPCVVGEGAGESTGEGTFVVTGDTLTFTNENPGDICGKFTLVQTWERI